MFQTNGDPCRDPAQKRARLIRGEQDISTKFKTVMAKCSEQDIIDPLKELLEEGRNSEAGWLKKQFIPSTQEGEPRNQLLKYYYRSIPQIIYRQSSVQTE